MEKRLVIAIVLSAVVLFGWNFLFPPKEPPPLPPPLETAEALSPRPEAVPAPADPTLAAGDEEPAEAVTAELEQTVELNTDLFEVLLTNRGGRVLSWKLREYTIPDGSPLELWPRLVDPPSLPLSIELDDPTLADLLNDGLYEVERLSLSDGEQITFRWADGRGLSVTKELRFRQGSYLVGVSLDVLDRGRRLSARLSLGPGFSAQEKGEGLSRYYYSSQAVWNLGGEISRHKAGKLEQAGGERGNFVWTGLEDQFFAALLLPLEFPSQLSWRQVSATQVTTPENEADGEFPQEEQLPILAVALGEEGGQLFIGPKQYTMLRELGGELEKVVWFSSQRWLAWIVKMLYLALLWLHDNVAYNYGVAIIMATVALRVVLFPVNQYAMVHMKKQQLEMQKLQPKIKAIRNKYKKVKDAASRSKMNQETMEMYKREGVNPAGGLAGCLPLLAQFPILIGFYNMLTVSIELRGAPFFGWIQDLSVKDPIYITPILMGLTMFTQQKMAMSKIKDPQQLQQQRMMLFMPIMFTFITFNMPSGLVLYWFMNNLLGMGQQWLVNKHTSKLEQPEEVAPKAASKGDRHGERVRGKRPRGGQAGGR